MLERLVAIRPDALQVAISDGDQMPCAAMLLRIGPANLTQMLLNYSLNILSHLSTYPFRPDPYSTLLIIRYMTFPKPLS